MSGDEIIEDGIGLCNGINVEFSTSKPFESVSLWVWKNGQLILPTDDDGFDILSSTSYRMREPPKEGDSIRHRFVEG